MDDLSTMMRVAVAKPPPTHIDVDRLIGGERRRARTMAWTATGVGVAAAIAMIVTVPAMLTGAGPAGVAGPAGLPTSEIPVAVTPTPKLCAPLSPSPTGPQPPLQSHDTVRARPTEAVSQAVPRLTQSLRQALRSALPAPARVESLNDRCTDPQFQFQPSYREYEAGARVVKGRESGFLLVRVMPTAADDDTNACHASDDPKDCVRSTFPDGTVASANTMQVGDGRERQVSVLVRRSDGTSVLLIANNYSLSASPGSGKPTLSGANPPLTVEQLIEIGRNPGMSLYP